MKKITVLIILFSLRLYAGIGVGVSAVGSLPVELTTFTANIDGGNVKLNWVTATEINNLGFEIEKKFNGCLDNNNWIKIGFVKGNGTISTTSNYSYSDMSVGCEKISYRLRQVDYSGAFMYSKVIEVNAIIPNETILEQNYPNPFNPTTVISYSIKTASNVKLEVYDVLGNLVNSLVNTNQEAGSYSVNFDVGKLSSGIYYYKLQAGKFVSAKKMMILK